MYLRSISAIVHGIEFIQGYEPLAFISLYSNRMMVQANIKKLDALFSLFMKKNIEEHQLPALHSHREVT